MALRLHLRALGAALLLGATSAAAQRSSGYFELRRTYDDAQRVQLSLGDDEDLVRGGMWSNGMDASKLDGLTLRQLARDGDSMHFRLVRDAGVIDFVGRVSDDRVRGRYSFAPERRFADALAQRGVGRPNDSEQFQLALYDIGYTMLDELKAQRYGGVDVESLVRMGQHGATLDYVRAMDAAGYRVGTVERLTELRDHGVTASYARSLTDAGYRAIPVDQLRELRDHGVTAGFVRELAEVGITGVSLDELRRARDHGVSADFADGLQRAGFDRLSLDDLIRLRDHGVTASFARIARREYGATTVSALVRLRDEGMRE
jgi:hypothetical protein